MACPSSPWPAGPTTTRSPAVETAPRQADLVGVAGAQSDGLEDRDCPFSVSSRKWCRCTAIESAAAGKTRLVACALSYQFRCFTMPWATKRATKGGREARWDETTNTSPASAALISAGAKCPALAVGRYDAPGIAAHPHCVRDDAPRETAPPRSRSHHGETRARRSRPWRPGQHRRGLLLLEVPLPHEHGPQLITRERDGVAEHRASTTRCHTASSTVAPGSGSRTNVSSRRKQDRS